MKKKIPHCRNRSKNSIKRGHIHDRSLSWLGTGSLIKGGCVKLYLWAQTSQRNYSSKMSTLTYDLVSSVVAKYAEFLFYPAIVIQGR